MDTQRKGRKLKFFFRDLVRETSTHPTVSRKSRFDTDGALELGEALAARVGVWELVRCVTGSERGITAYRGNETAAEAS